MCHEYEPDELLHALRSHGPELLAGHFRPDPDLDRLIKESVSANTFRSFQRLARKPSELFREWAKSRLTYGALADLVEISDQSRYDQLLDVRFADLSTYWLTLGKQELRIGPGRKLINLLFKNILRESSISADRRDRLITLLHVPYDLYVLAAVRRSAASGEFGRAIEIPVKASMGFVKTAECYSRLQDLMRQIASAAGVPPICIDLLAWNQAHGM